jgi:hypothetical protein
MSQKQPEVSLYISSASVDRDIADAVAQELEARGMPVWSDRLINPARWDRQIEKALEQARIFIFILSPAALLSPWVTFELGVALSRSQKMGDIQVLPFFIRGFFPAALPLELVKIQGIDLKDMQTPEAIREIVRIAAATADNPKNAP